MHDRGRVLANLACAIADGAEGISDFRMIGDQEDLLGLVASVPTARRGADEITRGGERALGKLAATANTAGAGHGPRPWPGPAPSSASVSQTRR